MIRAATVALVLAISAHASASPVPMVAVPKGWTQDPEQGAKLATKVAALKHFGGAKVTVAAEAYVPPQPGVAMFVTRITADTLPGTREQAARAAIDDLHTSAAKAYAWYELPANDAHAIAARGEWADMAAGTQTVGVLVIAASASTFVAVRGECFSADKTDGAPINACVQALTTLDPGIAVADRIAFEAAPAGTAPPPSEPPRKTDEPARITDGQDVHLGPIRVAPEKSEADRRPVYLGAGIVVLAAVFWWNRRRREKFEREDAGVTTAPRDAETADDADDLAAAARGETPKDEA